MNYEIIFYHAGRTAETEKLLQTLLTPYDLEGSGSKAATEPSDLPALLKDSVSRCRLVFISGGLDGSHHSTDTLLSTVLSSSGGEIRSEKLIDDSGSTAYLLRAEQQTLVLLPDETEVIRHMMEKRLLSELQKSYELTYREDSRPPIETITQELDRQLSAMPRKPVGFCTPDPVSPDKGSSVLRILAIVFGAAAVLQGTAAVILLFL